MTVSAACLGAGISRRCYYRWLARWRAERDGGLPDRSSAPHRSPQRLSLLEEARVTALRPRTGFGPDRLAHLLGLPAATIHRVLRRHGLVGRRVEREPVVRYEHEHPGGLVHLDTKKLGRIVGGPGHRATGDRRTRRRGVGWEVLHVAIDDATRLVYAELLPDERKGTTTHFALRALRWFARAGRDACGASSPTTAAAYRSRVFRSALPTPRHRRTPDPTLPAADERQGRSAGSGPSCSGVPVPRGLRQLGGAIGLRSRALHRVLQRTGDAPSGHRRTDATSAAQREAALPDGVTNVGDYT